MKREAFNHPKLARLARTLGIERYSAWGLAGGLWNLTGLYAPDGGVGVLEDWAIAEHLCWPHDEAVLIESMIRSKLVDEIQGEARLYVHDWHDHCEDRVHAQLARARLLFSNGYPPKPLKLGTSAKSACISFYEQNTNWEWDESEAGRGFWKNPSPALKNAVLAARQPPAATGSQKLPTQPNPTPPSPTQPDPTQPKPPEADSSGCALSGGRAGSVAKALAALGINRGTAKQLASAGLTIERAKSLWDEVDRDKRVRDRRGVFVQRARDELDIVSDRVGHDRKNGLSDISIPTDVRNAGERIRQEQARRGIKP